jgi:hypothetical protein
MHISFGFIFDEGIPARFVRLRVIDHFYLECRNYYYEKKTFIDSKNVNTSLDQNVGKA